MLGYDLEYSTEKFKDTAVVLCSYNSLRIYNSIMYVIYPYNNLRMWVIVLKCNLFLSCDMNFQVNSK